MLGSLIAATVLAILAPAAAAAKGDESILDFPPTPSAGETLDVGMDLGSPVPLDYFDRRPLKFAGKIGRSK